MSTVVILVALFGLPTFALAFAPRSFRRFCLFASLPFVTYFLAFPVRGADNPAGIFEAIPIVALVAAVIVEVGVFVRRLLTREVVNG